MDSLNQNSQQIEQRQKPNLAKNYILNLICQIFAIIAPFVTAPYLSRVFHEAGNGQISYSLSIISFFTLLANLGFTMYGQREISKVRDDPLKKSVVFWEVFLSKCMSTAVSLGLFFCIFYLSGFSKCNDLILISCLLIFSCAIDVSYLFQGEEDFRSIAIFSIISKAIHIALVFLVVKTENDVWVYCLFNGLATVFGSLLMWVGLRRYVHFVPFNALNIKRHFWPSFLIFLPTVAVTVCTTLDKVMIGLLASNSDYENGCYEQAYKINNMVLPLVMALSPVMIPRNAYDYKNKDLASLSKHLYLASNYVWLMGTPLIAGFCALSGNLSFWFLGDGYSEVPLLLDIMSVRFLASSFNEVFSNQLFVAIGKEKYATMSAFSEAFADVLLNFLLIPNYGAVGAAIATAIVEVIGPILLGIIVFREKYMEIKKFFLMSWKYLIASALMFLALWFLQKLFSYSIWSFLLLFLIGSLIYGILLFLFRDSFFSFCMEKSISFFKNKIKSLLAHFSSGKK